MFVQYLELCLFNNEQVCCFQCPLLNSKKKILLITDFNSKYEIYQFIFGFDFLFEPNSVHKWVGAGQGGPHYVFPPPQENVLCPLMNWAPVMILCGMSCASLIVDKRTSNSWCSQRTSALEFSASFYLVWRRSTWYWTPLALNSSCYVYDCVCRHIPLCVYLCLPVCMWLWIWVHYLVKRLHHHHMVWWPSLPSIWATWLNLNHGIAIA